MNIEEGALTSLNVDECSATGQHPYINYIYDKSVPLNDAWPVQTNLGHLVVGPWHPQT